MRRRRILFLSLELAAGTFSGNGVLALSQVGALHQLGHQLLIISGGPKQDDGQPRAALPTELQVLEIELPVWGRLDAGCSWREFAAGCSGDSVVAAVADFSPEVVMGVDWHSALAYQTLREKLKAHSPSYDGAYIYLNYRVYSRTAKEDELDFIRRAEASGVEMAAASVALSRGDAEYIQRHLSPAQGAAEPPAVLLPSLRADMMEIPLQSSQDHGRRPYLTCCVRLSPEKEPERYIDLVIELKHRGALEKYSLTPMWIAAANTPYAEALKTRLREAVPEAVVQESFVGPRELADIAAATRLNVHPCLYDAYGMTVVEMASQGAPSVINCGGAVGATELLRGGSGESFEVDMSVGSTPHLADAIEMILSDPHKLQEVSAAAAEKARSWGAVENASALMHIAESVWQ